MTENEVPIACRLDALTEAEHDREQVLLAEHLDAFVAVEEHDDGWSFRYGADPALFARMAELVALEHRCCPFLDFELSWKGVDEAPTLRIGGGERIKDFVAATFQRDRERRDPRS